MRGPELSIPRPYDSDMENLVLGTMLLQPEIAVLVSNLLKPDAFHTIAANLIYTAMLEMIAEGTPVDILTLIHHLRKSGKLQDAGGHLAISQLTDRVSSASNIETHCRMLEEFAIRRRLINLCEESISKANDPTEDVFEACERHGDGFVELGHVDPQKLQLKPEERITKAISVMAAKYRGDVTPGIMIGLDAIDRPSGGFQTGLWILAARPGAGKTELATYIAHQVAAQKMPVYFAQVEMSENQSVNREISKYTGIAYSKINKGHVTAEDIDKIGELANRFHEYPVYLDCASGLTPNELVSKIKFHHKRSKIKMAIVDYLQIMDIKTPKGGTRDMAIGTVTRKLKALANELDIPILVLAQLSRATDHRRPLPKPEKSDLRESGNIENDADAIIFLYYAENYRELDAYKNGLVDENGTNLEGVLEIIFDKNRYGRPNTSEYCRWNRGYVQYTNMNEHVRPYEKPIPHPDQTIEPRVKPNSNFLKNDAPF